MRLFFSVAPPPAVCGYGDSRLASGVTVKSHGCELESQQVCDHSNDVSCCILLFEAYGLKCVGMGERMSGLSCDFLVMTCCLLTQPSFSINYDRVLPHEDLRTWNDCIVIFLLPASRMCGISGQNCWKIRADGLTTYISWGPYEGTSQSAQCWMVMQEFASEVIKGHVVCVLLEYGRLLSFICRVQCLLLAWSWDEFMPWAVLYHQFRIPCPLPTVRPTDQLALQHRMYPHLDRFSTCLLRFSAVCAFLASASPLDLVVCSIIRNYVACAEYRHVN